MILIAILSLFYAVPSNWGSIQIRAKSRDAAQNGSVFTLLCTLEAIAGMTLPPTLQWVGPDGTVVRSDDNRTVVGMVRTQGTVSTISLSFNPVLTSDGGMYMCRAAVYVYWMSIQPRTLTTLYDMPVTGK